MGRAWILFSMLFLMPAYRGYASEPIASRVAEIRADVLRDKIRGGLLGQMLGNLNGLPHEMKYIHEPGDVQQYQPSLPHRRADGR